MIAVVYLMGPLHGKVEFKESDVIPEYVNIQCPTSNLSAFETYKFGEPYQPFKSESHSYRLQEKFDIVTEECAIYLHSEICCAKTYAESDLFKKYLDSQVKNGPDAEVHNIINPKIRRKF